MLMRLAEGLWLVDHDFSMMGASIGTRTTVIRLADGGLFLHAPGPPEPGLAEEIEALGEVRHLVAPNDFHHLFILDHASRWPEARVHLAPGLTRKRPELSGYEELGEVASEVWSPDLDQLWIRGAPRVNEIVFFHRASRTLLLTDLVFNVTQPPNFMLALFLRLNQAKGLGMSRLMRLMLRDRRAARESLLRLFAWDFDRVILCHGEILESGGKPALEASFRWLLEN